MLWGGSWGAGSPWGLGVDTGDTLCDQIKLLVWSWTSQSPDNTLKTLCALVAKENARQIDVLAEVLAAFSLDDATGDRLDKIGSLIGLPRQGFADDRYRVFLQIQAQLVLSAESEEKPRTGSHENILTICRTFIGSGVPDPIVLLNLPPLAISLTVPGVTVAEAQQLAAFITVAVDACVYGLIIFSTSTGSLWGSRNYAITGAGTWGSRNYVIAGASTWGYAIAIGI